MTADFTPPGRSHSGTGNANNRADARATSASGAGQQPATASNVPDGPRTMFAAGRGVMLAAWIAIAAGVALLIGISWSAALSWADDTTNLATVGETGQMSAVQVVPGMCLDDLGADGDVQDVNIVACDEPHQAEVFTQLNFDLAKFPGAEQVTDQALDYCADRLTGLLPEEASWVAWVPSQDSWSRGDRLGLCIATFDEPVAEPLSPQGIEGLGGEDVDGLNA